MSGLLGHVPSLVYLSSWALAWAVLLLQSRGQRMKVLVVIDGDTFELLDSKGKKHRVRLRGVDCPEIGQPYGVEIREIVAGWMRGQWVRVALRGRDRYRRRLGHVWLPDGSPLARRLLRQGLAHPLPGAWSPSALLARICRRGLWTQSRVVLPWQAKTRRRGLLGWLARRGTRRSARTRP